MRKIIATVGIPACGKSTWAKKYIKENKNCKRVNKDDLRAMLDDSVWSQSNEDFIKFVQKMIIRQILIKDWTVIVDDTNIMTLDHLKFLRQLASELSCDFEIKIFDTPLNECLERNRNREAFVPEDVIIRMHKKLIAIDSDTFEKLEYIYEPDES